MGGGPSINMFKGVSFYGKLHYVDTTWLLLHLSVSSSIHDFILRKVEGARQMW